MTESVRERERERAANKQTVKHETTRKEEQERPREKNADNTEGGVSDS